MEMKSTQENAMRLRNKVAVVTGSTRGIGEAIVRLFHKEGAKVVITGRDRERGMSIREELEQDPVTSQFPEDKSRALFLNFDVTRADEVARATERILEKFGSIDILVNNAGAIAPVPVLELTEDLLNEVMDTNFKGALYCSQVIGPHMMKQKHGVIVNIASIAGHYAISHAGAYGPAKAALILLTKQSAMEWARYNIRVNSISPGLVRTPLSESVYRDEALNRARCDIIPLGRIGTPRDVAQAALFLCSEESSYITAQDIIIDGGLTDVVYQNIPGKPKKKE
jgi:NAD(P)-dependent dehydrogenase (short-subunit alcohol dehydrogenase family)